VTKMSGLFKFGFSSSKEEVVKGKSAPPDKKHYEKNIRKRGYIKEWEGRYTGLKLLKIENESGDTDPDGVMICTTCQEYPAIADKTSSLYIGCTSFRTSTLDSHWTSIPPPADV
jgi:hypothetical protein